jgi:hypothetical protein
VQEVDNPERKEREEKVKEGEVPFTSAQQDYLARVIVRTLAQVMPQFMSQTPGAPAASPPPSSASPQPSFSSPGQSSWSPSTQPTATHRSTYPAPLPGTNPTSLLNAAAAQSGSQVNTYSHPSALNSSTFSACDNSPLNVHGVTVNIDNRSSPRGPAAVRSGFEGLPFIVFPEAPSESTKEPKTISELEAVLRDWLHRIQGSRDDVPLADFIAMQQYVDKTLEYARLTSPAAAMLYHKAAVAAAMRVPPLYAPLTQGPTYTLGYTEHIIPLLLRHSKADYPRKSGKPGKRTRSAKEKTTPSPSTPLADQCTMHPWHAHTNADCLKQVGAKRAKTSASSRGAAAAPDKE